MSFDQQYVFCIILSYFVIPFAKPTVAASCLHGTFRNIGNCSDFDEGIPWDSRDCEWCMWSLRDECSSSLEPQTMNKREIRKPNHMAWWFQSVENSHSSKEPLHSIKWCFEPWDSKDREVGRTMQEYAGIILLTYIHLLPLNWLRYIWIRIEANWVGAPRVCPGYIPWFCYVLLGIDWWRFIIIAFVLQVN